MSVDVSGFRGDPLELKWNRKGAQALDQVVPLCSQRRVAVQAGGCLGVFAKYLAARFDAVYVFEPSAQFVDMTANAPEPNVVRLQAALGSAPGLVDPVNSLEGYSSKKTQLHSGMTQVRASRGIVPTIRLDDLALPVVDLLYLDVEGYELFALQGARDTLRRCRPVVGVEINGASEYYGVASEDVRTHLRVAGYSMRLRVNSDEIYVHGSNP